METSPPSVKPTFKKIDSRSKLYGGRGDDGVDMEAEKAAQLQQMMDRAFQEGYAKGMAEGKTEERQLLTPCLQSIEKMVRDFEAAQHRLASEAEAVAVKLALNIARKILQTEPALRPEILLPIASAALRKVMDHNRITMRINPKDLEILEQRRQELQAIVGGKEAICLEGDENISPGGCFIETDFGDIDARIESQLKVIEDALMSERAQSDNGEA